MLNHSLDNSDRQPTTLDPVSLLPGSIGSLVSFVPLPVLARAS